jgi:hypothetical protein
MWVLGNMLEKQRGNGFMNSDRRFPVSGVRCQGQTEKLKHGKEDDVPE